MSLSDPYKAGDVIGLALRHLDVLQESGEARMRVTALEASGTEQLVKIDVIKSHEQGLVDKKSAP